MSSSGDETEVEQAREQTFGKINEKMICPHCQAHGTVRTLMIRKDGPISREKLTMAWITGGITMLTNGLTQEVNVTQAHCDNCENTWGF